MSTTTDAAEVRRQRTTRGKQATCALCGKRVLVRGPSWFTQRTEGGQYQVIHWTCFYGRSDAPEKPTRGLTGD